ncbi:MAG TPA: hypothetical protein VGB50_08190 [Flavobacterium sp.]|jgi:hypothetical protein
MKRKLEAELISIAHRILKMKNKSDVVQLHEEARKLYEKISILRFAEENFSEAKPTIGRAEIEEKLDADLDYLNQPEAPAAETQPLAAIEAPAEPEPVIAETAEEEQTPEEEIPAETVAEPEEEAANEIPAPVEDIIEEKEVDEVVAEAEEEAAEQEATIPAEENTIEPAKLEDELFTPAFEWAFEPKEEIKEPIKEEPKEDVKPTGQFAFDDLLGPSYKDPVFVKPEDLAREKAAEAADQGNNVIPITRLSDKVPVFKMNNSDIADKAVSLNDRLSKGITVGLNDRIAFVNNLFDGSNEDYNRVLSQLLTFNSYAEAQEFIDQMVKPDYNNWNGKDEYAQRFMEVVEKKFS